MPSLIVVTLGFVAVSGRKQVQAAAPPAPTLEHPDAVCASCHQAIYDRYEQTGMAKGSGIAADALLAGGFHHQASGVDYRVFLRDGTAWMSYSRNASDPRGALAGEQQLQYYVGSGHRGRTYLYRQGGQWFELPINYYTRRNVWDMAPAFDNANVMPAPLPVDPNCLHCHATDVQPNLPTARSRYASVPFRQGGIGCSACHGDPAQHLAQHGHGPIVNPGKLSPTRRDSSCIQCHLEGDAVIYRPGRSLAQFRPGDDLTDFAVYFVRAQQSGEGRRATSQYEALLRSACKRASGDKLTCTSCHDPHYDPPAAERVQYFRDRCLACHNTPAIAVDHFPKQPDCAQCHMPSRNTTDISHEQVTDHDIEARPATTSLLRDLKASTSVELVPVGGFAAGDREYGLAYAQVSLLGASRGDAQAMAKALRLLTLAAAGGANDPELMVRLGYLQQLNGADDKARASYTEALNADPHEPSALADLAVLDAAGGRTAEAVRLLQRLMEDDPTQTAAGLNLAFIQCKLGRTGDARALTQRLSAYNPDDPQLREYLLTGNYAGQSCPLTTQK